MEQIRLIFSDISKFCYAYKKIDYYNDFINS